MKLALLLLLIASTALAKPIPKATPVTHGEAPALVKDIPVAEIIQTLEHMRAIVSEQTHELDAARDDTASFRKQAQDAQAQVLQAKGETSLLQHHIDDLTAWGIAEQSEKQKAQEQVAKDAVKIAKFNKLCFWISFAAACFAALYCFELFKPAGFIGHFFPLAAWLQYAGPLFVWALVFGAVQLWIRNFL